MTTPTGAFRFACRGLAAFALVALIPVPATAQSSSRPELQRVTGTVIAGGPLTEQPTLITIAPTASAAAQQALAAGARIYSRGRAPRGRAVLTQVE